MGFAMCRVFCAAPGNLELERLAFYDEMGAFNAEECMPRGILFIAVSVVPTMLSTIAYMGAIQENIRDAKYYVQVLQDSWGSPERDFEWMYRYAAEHCARSVFFKVPAGLKESLPSGEEFSSVDEFKRKLRAQLGVWLAEFEALN